MPLNWGERIVDLHRAGLSRSNEKTSNDLKLWGDKSARRFSHRGLLCQRDYIGARPPPANVMRSWLGGQMHSKMNLRHASNTISRPIAVITQFLFQVGLGFPIMFIIIDLFLTLYNAQISVNATKCDVGKEWTGNALTQGRTGRVLTFAISYQTYPTVYARTSHFKNSSILQGQNKLQWFHSITNQHDWVFCLRMIVRVYVLCMLCMCNPAIWLPPV